MSEHTMSEIPATPMDAIKQIYKLFQTSENFTTRVWARDRWGAKVTTNDACCWCLGGAIFHVYNLDADILDCSEELPISLKDTFKILWEKLPVGLKDTFKILWEKLPTNLSSKMNGGSYYWGYIDGITAFNDMYGYTEVMRLLQAVIDDTEYMQIYAGGVDV